MRLKVIRGMAQARKELFRVDVLNLDSVPQEVIDRTEKVFGERLSPMESVQRILEDVRLQGDNAIRHYSRILDGVEMDGLEVSKEQITRAYEQAPGVLVEALEFAAKRIDDFHRATMRKSWVDLPSGIGELVVPIERVGIYAPGGTASYPSTVLMTAIPARVAGVKEIVLATPPRDGENPDITVLAAAKLAGVDRVIRVGGVQAIGAMAFGTETLPKVDKICGPGNLFVTIAKKLVFGQVDIDGLYGPTETVVIADETASPAYCAADMLAQAEHDPQASAILVTTSSALVGEIEKEVDKQLASLERGELAGASLERQGKVILVDDMDDALELANHIAPEHLCMMVEEPWAWAGKVKHAGGVFLGPFSPEVMGDYVAGPSHVMPTGGTARFSSALSVHHFLKTMPVVGLKPDEYHGLAEAAAVIARAEGLTGHARAVEGRLSDLTGREDMRQRKTAP
ncbi:MAG: histidinol dehydrogenase [Dehalococcoidia bacterium]|nr:histidinol dehydrogenase [Dehalococcoidia bacterium]